MKCDLVIRNGTIVDGTGAPRFVGDIAVVDGRIQRVGDVGDVVGVEEIDASGLIVAPGVIDPHTHYDGQVFWDPWCTNSGLHGVTTVIVGNCGFGFMPCRPEHRDRYMAMMETTEQISAAVLKEALPWDWVSFPEWMESLKRTPKGVNVGGYLPLNSLLIYVMGVEAAKTRPANAAERAEMRRLLHEAMDAGAMGFGFSFLQMANSHKDADGSPMPTDTMDIEEAYNLATVLRERGEGTIQALAEVPTIDHAAEIEELARISGRPVLHNVTMAFDALPDYHRDRMAWLDQMAAKGLQVYSQALAMRGWNEMVIEDWDVWVGNPLFGEFQAAGDAAARAVKAADPEFRERLRAQYTPESMAAVGGPIENYLLINSAGHDKLKAYEGQSLGAIAQALGEHVTDVLMDLIAATGCKAEIKLPAAMSRNVDYNVEMMKHPRVLPGTSDGGAHIKFWSGGQYPTDLIGWLVRENGRMTLEELHYKLSAVPAQAMSLADRGTLEEGKRADIYLYDFDSIDYNRDKYDIAHDLPGGDWRRIAYARGIEAIIVNGVITFRGGQCTGATPGAVVTGTKSLVGA